MDGSIDSSYEKISLNEYSPLGYGRTNIQTAFGTRTVYTQIALNVTDLNSQPVVNYDPLSRLFYVEQAILSSGGFVANIKAYASYDGLTNWLPFNDFYDQEHTYGNNAITYFSGGFYYTPPSSSPPVPVPPSVWLLGSGLIGLVGLRRKFRK